VVVTETGLEIAQWCDGHQTPAEIAARLADTYGLPAEVAEADTAAYLEHLAASGLLEGYSPARSAGSDIPRVGEVAIHLTNRCNLDCRHCYAQAGPTCAQELSPAQVRELLDRVRGQARSIVFSGGEPLMYEAWREVTDYACGIAPTKLVTNGTLFTAEDCDWLIKRQVALQISADGATAETHDWLRGAGSFAAMAETVRRLVEAGYGYEVSLTCTLSRRNYAEAEQLAALAAEWGVSGVHFVLVNRHGRAAANWAELELPLADYIGVCRRLSALRFSYGDTPRLSGCVGDFVERSLFQDHAPSCPVGQNLMVEASGEFLPCILLTTPEFRLGRLGETDPLGTFSSNERRQALEICQSRLAPEGICGECDWRKLCQGACPGAVLWQRGTLQGLDGLCDLRRELYIQTAFAKAAESLGQHPATP
jgi:radical SAM protein with 4Fe4S-binding SPASM domain